MRQLYERHSDLLTKLQIDDRKAKEFANLEVGVLGSMQLIIYFKYSLFSILILQ